MFRRDQTIIFSKYLKILWQHFVMSLIWKPAHVFITFIRNNKDLWKDMYAILCVTVLFISYHKMTTYLHTGFHATEDTIWIPWPVPFRSFLLLWHTAGYRYTRESHSDTAGFVYVEDNTYTVGGRSEHRWWQMLPSTSLAHMNAIQHEQSVRVM